MSNKRTMIKLHGAPYHWGVILVLKYKVYAFPGLLPTFTVYCTFSNSIELYKNLYYIKI